MFVPLVLTDSIEECLAGRDCDIAVMVGCCTAGDGRFAG
jgi:hypothetical protein